MVHPTAMGDLRTVGKVTVMTSEAAALVHGAVDVYTHAYPDRLPRRTDDLQLARESAAAGYAAVVHRNHHSSTVERAQLAAAETGFRILGSVLLNDSVGGIDPWVVDHSLRMGAAWIGMPTLSSRTSRSSPTLHSSPDAAALLWGPGDLTVTDDNGVLRPDAASVVHLVCDAHVALHVGYGTIEEQLTVAEAAAGLGHDRTVITYPRFTDEQFERAMAIPGLYFELSVYPIHPDGLAWPDGVARNTGFIRRAGVERCLVSSDGGVAGAPPPHELLGWALEQYVGAGFTIDELRVLVQHNPRLLLDE